MINVKDAPYNAVGDGVVNDTSAIQSALDAAGQQDSVYVPTGVYAIDQINISARRLFGERFWRNTEGGTVLKARSGFSDTSVVTASSNNFRLENILIDATGADIGLNVFKAHQSKVSNVSIFGSTVAGFFSNGSNMAYWDHCIAQGNLGIGFSVEAGNASVLSVCTAQNNGGDGFQIRKGFFSGSMTLRDCVAQVNDGHGISIVGVGADNGNFLGQVGLYKSWVEANGLDGIYLKDAHSCYIRDSRITPGVAAGDKRCVRLIDCVLCEVSGTRSGQYNNLDFLKIQIDGGEANIFENNYWGTQVGVQKLPLEYL